MLSELQDFNTIRITEIANLFEESQSSPAFAQGTDAR